MLVLSRRCGEIISIGDNIQLMVVAVGGNTVKMGISAPRDVPVHRLEVRQAIDSGNDADGEVSTRE